jgi:hypothetical protein
MNKFTTPILLVIVVAFFTISTVKDEKKIKGLEKELNHQKNQIDSLYHEIDTLIWESEIWDHGIIGNITRLLSAIIFVESSDNDLAYHKGEDAVGCMQIRQCMVDDVNRILKRQKSTKRYSYRDRWIRYKSIEMFDIYCKHYKLTTSEEMARCWNGGPNGMQNEVTAGYWKKVKNKLDS